MRRWEEGREGSKRRTKPSITIARALLVAANMTSTKCYGCSIGQLSPSWRPPNPTSGDVLHVSAVGWFLTASTTCSVFRHGASQRRTLKWRRHRIARIVSDRNARLSERGGQIDRSNGQAACWLHLIARHPLNRVEWRCDRSDVGAQGTQR